MNKIVRIMVSTCLLAVLCVTACSQPADSTSNELASTLKKITLDDSSEVLDLLPLLPAGFERLDAASEGMSNRDMELGSDFSEVEVLLNEDPYQLIFLYFGIFESRIDQASSDAFLKDDGLVESVIVENMKAGAIEEGYELDVTVDITHPQIGDLAALGQGIASTFGVYMGYDMLMFKVDTVYVTIFSLYLSEDNESLLPIGQELANRINQYSQ